MKFKVEIDKEEMDKNRLGKKIIHLSNIKCRANL